MSIDMYLTASQQQADSVSSMTKQHIEGYEQLQRAIDDFSLNSHFLTGATYDSAKAYFAQVLLPLAQGGILLSEAVEHAVRTFPEEYIANVSSGDLKQSELEEQIRRVDNLIAQAEEIGMKLTSAKSADRTNGVQVVSNTKMMGVYETVKRDLEEKLRRLMAFNRSSSAIFMEITSLEQALIQGLSQVETAFNVRTGTFNLPSEDKLAWRTTIKTKVKEKERLEMENLRQAFEKGKESRTYQFVEVSQGAGAWLWVKNPKEVTQTDLQFSEQYQQFIEDGSEDSER